MFSIYGLILLLTSLVIVFLLYLKWKSNYWQRRNIESFPTSLIYGNVEDPFRSTISLGEQIERLYRRARKEGLNYVGIYTLLQVPSLIALKLDYVKLIMAKDFQHFVDRGLYHNEKDDPISAHLFAIGGQKWRNLRVKMTPTFTAGKMKQMFQIVADCGTQLERILDEKFRTTDAVDIKEVLGCYATDIICSCAFGLNVHTSTDPNSEFRKYGKQVFEIRPSKRLQLQFATNFQKIAKLLHMRFFPVELSDFFTKIVTDTIKYRKTNNYVRNDFLQLMIELQNNDKSITSDIITAQCFVFFIAGFETSSTAMTFALYELASNQEIQDKVRAEINSVLKEHDGKFTYDSIMDMKYLGQVIDETLRKWPPAAVIRRNCVKTYKFPDGAVVEEGTTIVIPVSGIHHDEEYYPNPYEFDPERFNDENRKNIPDYAYLPFGEGPRLCIGMRFGIMQTKVGLTSVLRNYRITLNKKTQLPIKLDKNSIIPTAKGGIWLNLEKL